MKARLRKLIISALEKELDEFDGAAQLTSNKKTYKFLEASECLLIEAYEHSIDAPGAANVDCDGEGGSIEAGFILHWLNYPDSLPVFLEHAAELIAKALKILSGGEPLPASKINPALYRDMINQAKDDGIIASDGTIFGTGKYEQLDMGWFTSLLYYVYYQVRKDKIHPFNPDAQHIKLKPGSTSPDGDTVSIAIVGDWGTGEYNSDGGPAIAVMEAISSLNPDYIIHLGDVYYAGTEGVHIPWDKTKTWGEEDDHLMDLWPEERSGGGAKSDTSFTLNSNHEMYDGANGYFNVALDQEDTPFAPQKNASFFALDFDPWLIIGLDSAYYSPAHNLFMDGSLNGENGGQSKWCRKLIADNPGKKIIVMSHHNGVAADGSQSAGEKKFWDEVCHAINDQVPDYWYWGHIHLGVVYDEALPTAQGANLRCVGHGAIPYGEPWGLEGVKDIDYYPKTSVGDGLRVRNGFSLMALSSQGGITETFYEVEAALLGGLLL